MSSELNFDHITIILHQPRFAENIGATARAAWNMGFPHIGVVKPEDTDWERMTKLSTHVARGVLERMKTYASLDEALAPFQYIVGTTARLGGQRKEIISPWQAASKIRSLGPRNRIALLFGPENRGLSNEELRFCHCTVNIPTASASSLNLAQGVLILCYEILLAHRPEPVRRGFRDMEDKVSKPADSPSFETTGKPSSRDSCDPEPILATSFELEGMYQHLSEVLQLMDFLDEQNPGLWMMSLRRFFSRIGLYSPEVRMIRGICRQLKWLVTNSQKSAR
jgi:tRNA/rRNA methyltransferase